MTRVAIAPTATERRFRYFPRLRLPLLTGLFFLVGAVVLGLSGKSALMYVSLSFFVAPIALFLLIALARRRVVEVTQHCLVIPRLLRAEVAVPFSEMFVVDDGDGRLDIEDVHGRTFIILGDWLRTDDDFRALSALVKERAKQAKNEAAGSSGTPTASGL